MTVAELDQRIEAERTAIETAEARKVDLENTRRAALEVGDDTKVDQADADLANTTTLIARSRERIEILERRRVDTLAAAREAELDALTAKADDARKTGENLIAVYAKHAEAIGNLLPQLASIDDQIAEANRVLASAGRKGVPSPNAIRGRPTVRGTRIERRRVGIGEAEHPMHEHAKFDMNGNATDQRTGERIIDTFVEIDVEVPDNKYGFTPNPLQIEVNLPGIDPSGAGFWPNNSKSTPEVTPPASTGIVDSIRNLLRLKAA